MDLYYSINNILKEWNPICVKGIDLEHEYERYIDEIIECVKKDNNLLELIEDIEGNRIGYLYTSIDKRLWVVNEVLKLF
ncbi:hypothetical protein [uncultured Algoriphagus sp.]|uniref:hypothetical protein n=1 Tax=uncultured Algoriphagus sp. TaxID=417365 RepID=UPI0030EE3B19|tara:strand:- start:98261 stop:98497 length:237 start_codon:yes stop_codon:yes gene_type:complete